MALLVFGCRFALAAEEANEVFESASEALESMQVETNPESAGVSANEVISQFFPEVEVDEGTYPASEFVEHDFLLRRQGPAKGHYSGRFFTKYSDDQISGVEKFEKELELFLDYKDLTSYLRFSDVNAFAGTNDPFRWEKGNVRYSREGTTVTAGSFGALFGRGLALNMFEDRFTEHDNEAEGIKVEQEFGESGELTVLTGKRKARKEFHQSEVSGVRWRQVVDDSLQVGAHVVKVEFPESLLDTATDKTMLSYELIGGDATVQAGDVQLYAEAVQLHRGVTDLAVSPFDASGEDGVGAYAAATYAIPGFATTVEYKDYKGIAQPFTVVPPVRMWNENRTADPADERGFGIDFNLAPWDNGSSINLHITRDNNHAGNEPYRETLFTYNSPTNKRTTYVIERWKVNQEGEKFSQHRATVNQRLDNDWTASAFVERKRTDLFGLVSLDWTYEVDVNYGSKFFFLAQREASSRTSSPNRWGLYEVRYLPTENQEIHVLVGSRREAFVCSGGICRLEPAFDGVRIDYLLRF